MGNPILESRDSCNEGIIMFLARNLEFESQNHKRNGLFPTFKKNALEKARVHKNRNAASELF